MEVWTGNKVTTLVFCKTSSTPTPILLCVACHSDIISPSCVVTLSLWSGFQTYQLVSDIIAFMEANPRSREDARVDCQIILAALLRFGFMGTAAKSAFTCFFFFIQVFKPILSSSKKSFLHLIDFKWPTFCNKECIMLFPCLERGSAKPLNKGYHPGSRL